MNNPKFEISPDNLSLTIEYLKELALRLEIEASALAQVNTRESALLAAERLEQAEEVRELAGSYLHPLGGICTELTLEQFGNLFTILNDVVQRYEHEAANIDSLLGEGARELAQTRYAASQDAAELVALLASIEGGDA